MHNSSRTFSHLFSLRSYTLPGRGIEQLHELSVDRIRFIDLTFSEMHEMRGWLPNLRLLSDASRKLPQLLTRLLLHAIGQPLQKLLPSGRLVPLLQPCRAKNGVSGLRHELLDLLWRQSEPVPRLRC